MLRAQFDRMIHQVLDFSPDTSDIIVSAGKALQAEVHGVLKDVPLDPPLGELLPFQTEAMAFAIMGQNRRFYEELLTRGSTDLTYELTGRSRFRVNVFSQRGSLSIVMRQLSEKIPTLEQLRLPPIFREVAKEKFGLVLVTGATGMGKSTSLAALVDLINQQFAMHVVTLENPVEYLHTHKRAVVQQREMGIDFDTFADGLRAALRQAPKVILVGEIRDRETAEIALQAAETGHLILATMHTSDAGQTINRYLGMFDLDEERLVRERLAESLKFVISQRLLPKVGGGRIAAFEVLRNTLRIKELILKGETQEKTYYGVLETSSTYGMITFDIYLRKLYEMNLITEENAIMAASDKPQLMKMIDKIKSARGEKVSTIEGLELDENEPGGILIDR
jgi:twitching motility protein PilT